MIMMPGVKICPTLLTFCGVWIVIEIIYNKCQWKTAAGWYTLLAVMTITSIGIVANIYGFTTLYATDTSLPELVNTDQHRYFYNALLLRNGITPQEPAYQFGYSYFILAIWKITGVTITPLLIVNQFAFLLTLLLTADITSKTVKHPSAPTIAIILCASVCYLLNHSTLLLKESLVTLSLVCYASAMMNDNKFRRIKLISAVLLLGLIRFHWLPYLLVITPAAYFSNKGYKKIITESLAVIIAVWTGFYFIYENIALNIITSTGIENSFVTDDNSRNAFWNIIGPYFDYPVWKKILLTPITAAVQVITPFPWNYGRDMIYGLTQWYSHIAYPWYAVFGLTAYFFVFCSWKKDCDATLRAISFIGLLLWLVPVYLFAGSVSRYALPAVPLLIPCAAYVLAAKKYFTKTFRIWFGTYCLLIAATLIVIYNLTSTPA